MADKKKFLTVDEMAEEIYSKLSEEDRNYIRQLQDAEEMIEFHHGVGTGIRNHYGLWDSDNPYTMIDPPVNPEKGFIDDPRHPDAVSHEVLKRVWYIVHGIPQSKYEPPMTMVIPTERETSDTVSSVASRRIATTVDDVRRLCESTDARELVRFAREVRMLAASCLAQDRTPGRRIVRGIRRVLGLA